MAIQNRTVKKRLGDILLEVGIITQAQLTEALEVQRKKGGRLGAILQQLGYCSEDMLLAFLGRQFGVSYVSLAEYGSISPNIVSLVPETVAKHQNLIPIAKEGNVLTIAMSDPLNVFATDDLKLITGCEIKVVIASQGEIQQAFEKYYKPSSPGPAAAKGGAGAPAPPKPGKPAQSMEDLLGSLENESELEVQKDDDPTKNVHNLAADADAKPIIRLVNMIMTRALETGVSDIHIEPQEYTVQLRYRLDGVLQSQPAPPKKFHSAIVSRIKVMAAMDIAEHRLPQDGRIKMKFSGREIALRVSTVPTPYGEKVVMRILDTSGLNVNLDQLGFEDRDLQKYKKVIASPFGILLVTGPTGSGKSTTLYSTLSILNEPDTNILTIEDPVEYQLPGITQVNARPDIGLSFANGLRAFLRQDPDVIMVGEIRDAETAEIAINAALTGHLVLSTLHTNDAPGAVTRLTNMGIEPFLTASTVIGVIAQRLVRTICESCKEEQPVPTKLLLSYGVHPEQIKDKEKGDQTMLFHGAGCGRCAKTGYKGRMGVYEFMTMSDPLRELILEMAPDIRIKEQARKEGMHTLREAALRKLLVGKTTMQEVLRVSQDEEKGVEGS
jgi:type IV pilus assembly protein PilB